MNILITGGTGTIGDYLIDKLLNSSYSITVITRDKSHVKNSWKEKVNFIEADIKKKGEWQEKVSGFDAVINLIGENIFAKRWTKEQKTRLRNSRIDTTENLCEAIIEADDKPEVFISVSGIDYYPPSKEKVYSENDDPSDSFVGKLTQDWEEPVRKLENTTVRHVIFRMGVALTYSGGGMERMFLPHKFFVGGWIGSGSQIYSWVHIEDFTGLLKFALENKQISGTYNGVAPDFKSMKTMATIGGEIMGRWTWTWVPGFILKVILGQRADLILKGRAVSSEKIINAGYEFKFPNTQEALTDILENY